MNKPMEIISTWIYNPAQSLFKTKKTEKSVLHTVSCSSKDSCDFYKRGECLLLNTFGGSCEHGTIQRQQGTSRSSQSFYKNLDKFNKFIEDNPVAKPLKSPSNKMGVINGVVHLPYYHLMMKNYDGQTIPFLNKQVGLFSNSSARINLADFNVKMIVSILELRPQALLGGEITSYQKEEVPKFIKHLGEQFPELKAQLLQEHPEYSQKFESCKSNIGRQAKLETLNPNVGTFTDIHKASWVWDGKYLISHNSKASFMLTSKFSEIRIVPEGDCTVKITDDGQVNSGTVFID